MPSHTTIAALAALATLTLSLLAAPAAADEAWEYGPYPGWEAIDYAELDTGEGRLLWSRSDGLVSLWALDDEGEYVFHREYGPYPGWEATDIQALPDGTARLLWANANGTASVWTLDPWLRFSRHEYRYAGEPGWMVRSWHDDGDGSGWMLWERGGQAAVWEVSRTGEVLDYRMYGPWGGWTPRDLHVNEDGSSQLLWTHADGTTNTWHLDRDLNYVRHTSEWRHPSEVTVSRRSLADGSTLSLVAVEGGTAVVEYTNGWFR